MIKQYTGTQNYKIIKYIYFCFIRGEFRYGEDKGRDTVSMETKAVSERRWIPQYKGALVTCF